MEDLYENVYFIDVQVIEELFVFLKLISDPLIDHQVTAKQILEQLI
jgi:hypothetical protein